MQTQTKQPNLQNQDSILSPLLNILLFGKTEAELIDENLFEIPYYIPTEGFENLVFSNGDFNPDNRLYIYECIWEFEKAVNIFDKVKLLLKYIESEEADKLIYEEIEQVDYHYHKEYNSEFVKSEIFSRLNKEILSKNNFPEEITQWLFKKCSGVALNMFEGSNLTEENYEEIFSLFEK